MARQAAAGKTFYSSEPASARSQTREMLSKVPEITIYFWIIKIMATTVGETAADLLNVNLHMGLTYTSLVMTVLFLVTLFFQFRAPKYVPKNYWLVVVMISVVGTLISDNLVDNMGIALRTTTILFSFALAATFIAWYASEKTLSIHSIYTPKREAFYWLAILFTFALGTSGGDYIAEGFKLGYLNSALIFAGLIALVTVAYYFFNLNDVTAFWIAYILTRPLGASCGDFLSQPSANGGLNLGTEGTSIIFLITILCLVVYLTKSRVDEISVSQSTTDEIPLSKVERGTAEISS